MGPPRESRSAHPSLSLPGLLPPSAQRLLPWPPAQQRLRRRRQRRHSQLRPVQELSGLQGGQPLTARCLLRPGSGLPRKPNRTSTGFVFEGYWVGFGDYLQGKGQRGLRKALPKAYSSGQRCPGCAHRLVAPGLWDPQPSPTLSVSPLGRHGRVRTH